MDNKELIENVYKSIDYFIELLEIVIWPIVLIIIFYTLRNEIRSLINRIKALGFNDNKIEFYNQMENQEITDTSQVDDFLGQFSEGAEDLMNRKYQQIVQVENVESLKKHLKANMLINEFNFIYYNIFGSQLKILLTLEKSNLESYISLKRFYDEAKATYPATFPIYYPFEQYIDFLTSRGLIEIENDFAKLTSFGRDFLKYLRVNGIGMIKIN